MSVDAFLAKLEADAQRSSAAEDEFRRQIATRTRELELERAFAFRRLNLMRATAEAIGSAETEEAASAYAAATLRARLGWAQDSEARAEVTAMFAPVAQALFHARNVEDGPDESRIDVGDALAEFEAWYAASHPVAFWTLFENVMPETPVVDF